MHPRAPDPALRSRFLHFWLQLVGNKVTVRLKDGTTLNGIFHTATPFASLPSEQRYKVVLMAATGGKLQPGTTAVLDMNDIVDMQVKAMRMEETATKGQSFTDAEIRAGKTVTRKELQEAGTAWTSPPPSGGATGLGSHIGEWDQFKANEELFNVKASYNEAMYTTELDRSRLDHEKIQQAERLAREIETSTSNNVHVAEERGQTIQTDFDEEDRYSGVLQPKRNYAAAVAANAEAPPGFIKSKEKGTEETNNDKNPSKTETKVEKVVEPELKKEEEVPIKTAEEATQNRKEEPTETKQEETKTREENEEIKKDSQRSKLNVNAKEFKFNANAQTFTPGGLGGGVPPPPPEHHYPIDPNTGMPVNPYMPPMQPGKSYLVLMNMLKYHIRH